MLTTNLTPDGLAVFVDRNKFIGWVEKEPRPSWDTNTQPLWVYEVAHTYFHSEERYATAELAVEALHQAWAGDWRKYVHRAMSQYYETD